jgi:hypothetical protein
MIVSKVYVVVLCILVLCGTIVVSSILLSQATSSQDNKTLGKPKVSPRIKFINFWHNFPKNENYFTNLLRKYGYSFEVVDTNPDIIIFSVFGQYRRPKNSVRTVHFTGENTRIVKGVNLNLTFDHTSKYNNIRLPLWLLQLDKKLTLTQKETEHFCCFVYSHHVPYRNNFCKRLSKYKTVDCGGKCLNNVGGKVKDKIEFQKKYKFCIAYENSKHPGYTTEKILDAYKSNCIPIYCGSETISADFNPETFINAHDFDTDTALINYIKRVDTDESLYNSYMNKPIYSKRWIDIFNDPNETYFKTIAKKIIG